MACGQSRQEARNRIDCLQIVNTEHKRRKRQLAGVAAKQGGAQRKTDAAVARTGAVGQVRAQARGGDTSPSLRVRGLPGGACGPLALPLTPCVLSSQPQAAAPWPEAWRSHRELSCGGLNLGLSCFLNAAVQALLPVWYKTYSERATPTPLARLVLEQMDRLVHGGWMALRAAHRRRCGPTSVNSIHPRQRRRA